MDDGFSSYLLEMQDVLKPFQFSQVEFLLALFQQHISDQNNNL